MIDSIASPYIHAATGENFSALVLDNSQQGPVLVNFWSRKAGPCLRQYPLLDKVVHHYAGRMLLVNIDADSEVALTREYGVNSVPTLKLFRRGELIETRHGFQSEADLIKLLDQHVARDSDLALADAIDLYVQGKRVEAYEKIAATIVEDPVNPRLPLTLCKLLRHEGRHAEALKVITALPSALGDNPEISQLQALLEFHLEVSQQDITSLQDRLANAPGDHATRKQLIAQLVIQQQHEAALQQLVTLIEQDAAFDGNYAQQAMLRVFKLLGPGHPLAAEYRSQLKRYSH